MSNEAAPSLDEMAVRLAEISGASSAAEVLERLLSATAMAVPRASLFLVRRGRLRGYLCAGEGPEASRLIPSVDIALDDEWPAGISRLPSPTVLRDDRPMGPDYGQDSAAERAVVWLALEGNPAALLIGARSEGEQPWSPPALAILASAARSRLELELARKRAATPPEPHDPTPSAVPPSDRKTAPGPEAEAAPDRFAFTVTVGAATPRKPVEETGLAPYEVPEAGHGGAPPRNDDARRYARLIATDIRLYNEEAVILGRRQRDLARRLGDQMQRGRESFARRFADLGPAGIRLLEDAYVEVLGAGDPALLGLPVKSSAIVDGG